MIKLRALALLGGLLFATPVLPALAQMGRDMMNGCANDG